MHGRDLISIADLSPGDVQRVVDTALQTKNGQSLPILAGKTLALLFEKPSLRTRVSFDVAMRQLGGHALYLSPAEVGVGEREPVADVARVLSRYVDAIAARTFKHETVEELARWADVPLINALSDGEHPCQALADLLTIYEKKGRWRGLAFSFVGDGNNVARSLMLGAALVGMDFRIAAPQGYRISTALMDKAENLAAASGTAIVCVESPQEAVRGADVVYTDVWTSMGQEEEQAERRRAFDGYQLNAELLALASPQAIVMHDLPSHRGEEITDEVIEGSQSVVFDQAENRLHAQRAVLALILGEEGA
ncbi:MAG: ornithine carbamoyltransferase [Dehalococcoidia bacterium SM23_28_1]|nr:MAG: ornithine carbamoyltransferase [Dehalococcoidia bacterium SM23_28_1]